MKQRALGSLPVLMHHLVSNDTRFLSVTPKIFEGQCRALSDNGWRGIGLEEAEAFLIEGKPLPKKSFLMTFDDGYLDNYVYAFPIMQKYGHKGVVFAVSSRISSAQIDCEQQLVTTGTTLRSTMTEGQSVRGSEPEDVTVDNLVIEEPTGEKTRVPLFFNWDEARLMERSGSMAVAGHSVNHARVYTDHHFSQFIQPGDRLDHFDNITSEACYGMPAFAHEPELTARAFVPSSELIKRVMELVPQESEAARQFFASEGSVKKLHELVETFRGRLGHYETEKETLERMGAIMETSQTVLSRELGHDVKSFCWPWGGFCEAARQAGLKAGFKVFYTTKRGTNPPRRPLAVRRFKVKNKDDGGKWLTKRTAMYSYPVRGALYTAFRF